MFWKFFYLGLVSIVENETNAMIFSIKVSQFK